MIEIGSNLAAVLMALVAVLSAAVSVWRVEEAHRAITRNSEGIAWTARRVRNLERRSPPTASDDKET